MEKNKLKCQVVILPTAEKASPSNLYLRNNKELQYGFKKETLTSKQPQHLYFVSEREIKEDDWVLCDERMHILSDPEYWIGKVKKIKNNWIFVEEGQGENPEWTKKIEASTDPSLGLPLIPQSFIKKYVKKQGNIKKVMIEAENKTFFFSNCFSSDSIIASEGLIDTSIETTTIKTRPDNTCIVSKVKDTYMREEVIELLNRYGAYCIDNVINSGFVKGVKRTNSPEEWLNDNF